MRIRLERVTLRLEAEEGADEQKGRTRGPGLRAAGGRVLDREPRLLPRVAGERLREAAVEIRGRLEQLRRDPGGLLAVSVPGQTGGDQRVVVRPDRAEVVPDRVVRHLVGR